LIALEAALIRLLLICEPIWPIHDAIHGLYIRWTVASFVSEDQEASMNIAEVVYEQVKMLPEPLAREVLDFIGFLRERGERQEWRDLMQAQAGALASVWDSAEDNVWNDV
jgi:hypothetical protein